MTLSEAISQATCALIFVCLFSLASAVFSQEKIAHSLYSTFYKIKMVHCNIEASAEAEWHVLRIQIERHLIGVNCALSQQQTVALLSSILNAHKESGDTETYDSLFIGNIENYAWIQHYLGAAHRNKIVTLGDKSVLLRRNNYISKALSSPAVINVFNLAGEKYGYRFSTMNCKKSSISYRNLAINALCSIKIVRN